MTRQPPKSSQKDTSERLVLSLGPTERLLILCRFRSTIAQLLVGHFQFVDSFYSPQFGTPGSRVIRLFLCGRDYRFAGQDLDIMKTRTTAEFPRFETDTSAGFKLKCLFDDSVFQTMEADYDKSSTWIQKVDRLGQKRVECFQFLVNLNSESLENLCSRMDTGPSTTFDLLHKIGQFQG
jgi:hypothetical protein